MSSSYWAYRQLSNIHEDDFIEPEKNIARKGIKIICNGMRYLCRRGASSLDLFETEFDRRERQQEQRDKLILLSTTEEEGETAPKEDKQNSNKDIPTNKNRSSYVQGDFEIKTGNVNVEEHKDL